MAEAPTVPADVSDPKLWEDLAASNPAPAATPPPEPAPTASVPDDVADPKIWEEMAASNTPDDAVPDRSMAQKVIKGTVPPPIMGRVDHLNSLRDQGNEAKGAFFDAMRPVFESPGAGDAATLGDAAARLKALGVDVYDSIKTASQINAVMVEADTAANQVMKAMGIDRISASPEAVRKVRAQLQVATLVRHAPVSETEVTKLAGDSIRARLQTKLNEVRAEAQGSADPAVLKNADVMSKLGNMTAKWTDDEFRNILRLALTHQINAEDRVAQNSWEQWAAKDMGRSFLEHALGQGNDLHPRQVQALSDFPEQRVYDPDHANTGHQAATVAAILGKDWKRGIVGDYDNGRLDYNLKRAGWRLASDGTPVPGQFTGVDFVDMIPAESLKTLLDEAAGNTQTPLNQEIEAEWSKVASRVYSVYGATKGDEVRKQVWDELLVGAMKQRVQRATLAQTMGDEDLRLQDMSPYMKAHIQPGYRFGLGVLGILDEMKKVLVNGTTAVDDVMKGVPGIQAMAKDATYYWTGNTALSETTKGPSSFVSTVFKGLVAANGFQTLGDRLTHAWQQATGLGVDKNTSMLEPGGGAELVSGLVNVILGGTRKTMSEMTSLTDADLVDDLAGMQGASAERIRAAFDMEHHAGDVIFRAPFAEWMKAEEKRQQNLSGVLKGHTASAPLEVVGDVAKSLLSQMLLPVVDTAAALVDDPRQGVAYMMGFDLGGRGLKMAGAAKSATLDRLLQGYGLQQKLVSLAKYAPDQLPVFREAIGKEIGKYTPGAPDVTLKRLEAAGAAIDGVLEDAKASRFDPANAREMGRTVRKAWGDFNSDLSMEAQSIAHRVGAETPVGEFFTSLDQNWGKLIQRPGKWFDFLVSRRLPDAIQRSVERMMRNDTGLYVGPDTEDVLTGMRDDSYQKQVGSYMAAHNGEEPSMRQMLEAMPEQNRDVLAALNAADRLPNPESASPLWRRGFLKICGVSHPEVFERIVGGAEKSMSAAHEYALGLARAANEWAPVRARNDVIARTAEFVASDRLETRLRPAREGVQALIDQKLQEIGTDDPSAFDTQHLNELVKTRDQLDLDIKKQNDRVGQIQRYRSQLRAHDAAKSWDTAMEPSVLEAYQSNPELLRSVVEHNQELFGGLTPDVVAPEDVVAPRSAEVVARRQDLAGVDWRISGALDRREAATKDPVGTDETVKTTAQKVADAKARAGRLRQVATLVDKPATPENIERLKAQLGPEYAKVVEGLPLRKAETLRDVLQQMDDEVAQAHEMAPSEVTERAADDRLYHIDARNGALDPATLDKAAADAQGLYKAAVDSLRDGSRRSSAFYDAEAEVRGLKAERAAAASRLDRAEAPAGEYRPNAGAVQKYMAPLLKHRGMVSETVAAAESVRDSLRSSSVLRMRGNPFLVQAMPFMKKGAVLHDMSRSVEARLNAVTLQAEDLTKIWRKMTKQERQLLSKAQTQGVLPSALVKKFPDLDRAFYGEAIKGGEETMMGRLDRFWETEKGMFDSVFRVLDQAGMLDNKTLREFKKLGYKPRAYGIHERPRLVNSPEARAIGKAGKVGGAQQRGIESPAQLTDLSEFKLERDATQYRVRVDEPDAIVDEYFPDIVKAHDFIRHNYGQATIDGLVEKDGIGRGKTNYRDKIALAHPLGREGLKNLGYLGYEASPLKRIDRIRDMWRDVMMHSYVEALNLFGGLVLEDKAWNALNLKGRSGQAAAAQFVRVPNDRTHFGNLADKLVHKRVFAEMGAMVRTHDSLAGFLEGIRESFSEANYPIPDALVEKALSAGYKVIDKVATVAKTTQILQSWRTWVGNQMFNVVLDHTGQFGVYDLRNVKNLWWAIKQTSPLNDKMVRDPIYYDAVENGVVAGTWFDKNNLHIRRAWQDMVGFGTADGIKLKKLHAQRDAIMRKSLSAAEGKSTPGLNTGETEREMASINSAIDTLNRSFIHRYAKWGSSLFLDSKNSLGIPDNQTLDLVKKFYNQIDEHFKLAAYKNMLDSGVSKAEAIWRVKTFIQDYSRVPAGLRSKNPLLSLVTSFPAEMARLGYNYLRHYPVRTLSTLSAVAALNFTSMTVSNTNWDRLASMIHSRGARGPGETIKYMMTHLLTLDGNHNVVSDINTGNWLPAVDITTARGLTGVLTDQLMPPEKRGFGQEMAALGVGVLGQFYLNNPLMNTGAIVMGRNPVTGDLLVDPDTDLPTTAGQYIKTLAQNFISPLFPHIPHTPIVGRDWERVGKALEATAAINPKTGRPFQAPSGFASALFRAATGLDVRGALTAAADDFLGTRQPNQKRTAADDEDLIVNTVKEVQRAFRKPTEAPSETAEYSPYSEMRRTYFRMIQEAHTPEERKAADVAFTKLIREKTNVTEREAEALTSRLGESTHRPPSWPSSTGSSSRTRTWSSF
jgi:hypothetical protein